MNRAAKPIWLIAWAAVLLVAIGRPSFGEDNAGPGFEYIIYISRHPDRHLFQCRRVAPDSAFVTDPDVSGYYPYRLSRGDEHYVVIEPTSSMPIYWLKAEERHKKWIDNAAGSLQLCRHLLVKIERATREQKEFRRRVHGHTPRWQAALDKAKRLYVRRAGLKIAPDELDVLQLWNELTQRKQQLLRKHEAEPAAQEVERPEPEKEEAERTRQLLEPPQPAYLLAEHTPNDGGTHITVRWPVDPLDLKPRQSEKASEPTMPVRPAEPTRTPTEQEKRELEEIDEELKGLRNAVRYARFLEESEGAVGSFRQRVGGLRDAYLSSAAQFCLTHTLVRSETRLQLAPVLGVEPDEVTPDTVDRMLPSLSQRLQAARRRAQSADAGAGDYDEFDQFRYTCYLAQILTERADNGIPVEQIENDLLWQLSEKLADADLGQVDDETSDAATPPDTQALLAALSSSRRAGLQMDTDTSGQAYSEWQAVSDETLDKTLYKQWVEAKAAQLRSRLLKGEFAQPDAPHHRHERTRAALLAKKAEKRLKDIHREHARRKYYFRLAAALPGAPAAEPFRHVAAAAAYPAFFDVSKLTNLVFAMLFTGAVLFMIAYVRRHPHVFVRRIAGLEAVDEAIGRATEMGKPVLFVHGLTGLGDIAVLASLAILSRLARRIADYESDLLVVNNEPIVYSVSYEVVQEGYAAAGRRDAFKPDNVLMVASRQFPYVAAVAGIMARRRPAANFFMGYFFAESLILAEAGAMTGAIQIAGTDSFTQLPFFITTCDYTLMGEELYAASAYLSREPRMLGTIKAQDFGKSILLAAVPLGTLLGTLGTRILQVIFTAYEKGG